MSRKNHSSLRRVLILVVVLAACSADTETVVLSTGPNVVERPRSWGADDGSVQSLAALDAAAAVDLWNSTVAWNAAIAENERLAAAASAEAARQARESRPAPTYNGGSTTTGAGGVAGIIEAAFAGTGQEAKAVRVARCESGLDPGAANTSGRTPNIGLFQVDEIWAGDFTAVTGQPFWNGAYNASANARFARWLYDREGWGPWGGGDYCAAA